MSHLSPADLADAIGPEAAARVAAHLADCERCRRQVEELREMLAVVADADVPEPAPAFWPRMTARVVETASSGAMPAAPFPGTDAGVTWTRGLAAAAVVVFAVSAAVLWRQHSPLGPADAAIALEEAARDLPAVPEPAALDEASGWELVADANAGIDWDAVSDAGLAPPPGSADGALMQLSEGERRELARLLQVEIAGSL